MTASITAIDRQKVGANPQEICNKLSDLATEAQAAVLELQSGGAAGTAPVHFARGASTGNVASLAAFTVANDGITLVAGDRVLLKDQTTHSQNGIYVVGTVGGGTAPLTRAADLDANSEAQPGLLVAVSEGTAGADTLWMMTTNGAPVVGTDALDFAQAVGALLATAAPEDVGTGAAAVGVSTKAAKEDHVHHIPAATTVAPGAMPYADKAFLDHTRAARGTDIADADATIAVAQGYVRNCPTLTGNHICTLDTAGAVAGDWFMISRTSTAANTLAIVDGGVGTPTIFTFAASKQGGAIFAFDGTHWNLLVGPQSA